MEVGAASGRRVDTSHEFFLKAKRQMTKSRHADGGPGDCLRYGMSDSLQAFPSGLTRILTISKDLTKLIKQDI
jgi:hypothetical protein